MSNLHLVTGYAGQAHVTAADDGSFNTAIFGNGQYVLDIGSKFAASVVSNNKITIADGDLLMQGRHVRLNEGTTVDLTITNGTQGKLRNDLIVARYTKDSVSGVEQVNLVVIKGTAVDSDPTDPEYTSGDIINDHDLLNDMPLYRVPLNGLTVGTPVALFELASVPISDGAVTTDKLASGFILPLDKGGLGSTLPDIPPYALIRATSDLEKYPYLYYTATANGAFYATAANGAGQFGTLPIAQGGTGATGAAAALSNLGGVSIVKLWENASPTSSFSPQLLYLDFSGCTHVLILAYVDTGHAYTVAAIGVPGVYTMATVAWGNTSTNSHRLFSFGSTSSIWVDTGYSDSGTNNSTVIPYRIYGIKGVTS